ncbi:MAG: ABC transporter permease, partial [Acidimicrobiales bacterium]
RDRAALVGLFIIALMVLACLLAPWIAAHDPIQTNLTSEGRFQSPTWGHPFGTDEVGRDVFARILHGGRLSLGMALSATAGITVVGIVLGLAATFYGRFAETVVMRTVDVLLAMPTLILALVIVGLLGQGLRNLIITIIFVQWPRYARLVRGMALKVRAADFVEAGRAAGAGKTRLILRHILPNLIGPVVVFSTVDMGATLLAVSGLSFLGFGVAPPTAEWGAMLSEARYQIDRAPLLLVFPGAAISLVVLAFNLAGDGLRDLLDPRTQAAPPQRRRFVRKSAARTEMQPAKAADALVKPAAAAGPP